MNLKCKTPMVKPQSEYKVRLMITNLRETRKIARKLRKERGVITIPLEELFKYWRPEIKAIPCGDFKGFIGYIGRKLQWRR